MVASVGGGLDIEVPSLYFDLVKKRNVRMDDKNQTFDIPDFLRNQSDDNKESVKMSTVEEVAPKAKSATKPTKANGAVKPAVKAADKPKAKAVGKPAVKAKAAPKATAKAAKGSEKPKVAKSKAEPVVKDQWGFRVGSAKSKAVAMYATKEGATLEEVKATVGSIQLNVLNALEADGYEVKREKQEREDARSVTRYWLKKKK